MNKTNQEAVIEHIVRNSLDCIEKVAADAESARASYKRGNATVLARKPPPRSSARRYLS